MRLGRIGVFSIQAARLPTDVCVEAVQEIESLGFGTLWVPEGGFLKEAFSNAAMLLCNTKRMAVATAIANIHAREPAAMEHGARTLAEAFPDRFCLGLGVGHREEVVSQRGRSYERPLAAMRAYLESMDAAPYLGAEPAVPAPRLLAALMPGMLRLAAARTRGTHPYFVPIEHIARARDHCTGVAGGA